MSDSDSTSSETASVAFTLKTPTEVQSMPEMANLPDLVAQQEGAAPLQKWETGGANPVLHRSVSLASYFNKYLGADDWVQYIPSQEAISDTSRMAVDGTPSQESVTVEAGAEVPQNVSMQTVEAPPESFEPQPGCSSAIDEYPLPKGRVTLPSHAKSTTNYCLEVFLGCLEAKPPGPAPSAPSILEGAAAAAAAGTSHDSPPLSAAVDEEVQWIFDDEPQGTAQLPPEFMAGDGPTAGFILPLAQIQAEADDQIMAGPSELAGGGESSAPLTPRSVGGTPRSVGGGGGAPHTPATQPSEPSSDRPSVGGSVVGSGHPDQSISSAGASGKSAQVSDLGTTSSDSD